MILMENKEIEEVWTRPLGPTLQQLIQSNKTPIDKATAYFITMQIVNRIETLHQIGYSLGDLKTIGINLDCNNEQKFDLCNLFYC